MSGLECMEQTNTLTHTLSVYTRTRMYGTNQYIHTHCQLIPGLECMEQTNIFTHTVSFKYNRTRMYGTNQYIHTHCVS